MYVCIINICTSHVQFWHSVPNAKYLFIQALKSRLSTHMLLIIELQYKIDIVASNFCTDFHLYILHPMLAFKVPFVS